MLILLKSSIFIFPLLKSQNVVWVIESGYGYIQDILSFPYRSLLQSSMQLRGKWVGAAPRFVLGWRNNMCRRGNDTDAWLEWRSCKCLVYCLLAYLDIVYHVHTSLFSNVTMHRYVSLFFHNYSIVFNRYSLLVILSTSHYFCSRAA